MASLTRTTIDGAVSCSSCSRARETASTVNSSQRQVFPRPVAFLGRLGHVIAAFSFAATKLEVCCFVAKTFTTVAICFSTCFSGLGVLGRLGSLSTSSYDSIVNLVSTKQPAVPSVHLLYFQLPTFSQPVQLSSKPWPVLSSPTRSLLASIPFFSISAMIADPSNSRPDSRTDLVLLLPLSCRTVILDRLPSRNHWTHRCRHHLWHAPGRYSA